MKNKKPASVLVCVTGQRDCDRLILAGKSLAEKKGIALQVLCVQPTANGFCARSEEVEYLYQTTKEADAEMTIYFHDEAAIIAAGFAKQTNAMHIVTGMPDGTANGFVEIIHRLVPEIPVSMVSKDGKTYNMYPTYPSVRLQKSPAMG